ncbi:ABC transporter substrate-binding protein [Williamsia deligens]|uniref:ABC transporter substrate-binding protein n=1 Tax=Williamsia deligens TaxID=321325 RepID=A0ABW3G880_9NOCA|nr:ABC transporter substrate-binding protein [Williamsia deligens]MCP2194291.1 iron complex transport system substrate-binding protein [Williamsia deligens]
MHRRLATAAAAAVLVTGLVACSAPAEDSPAGSSSAAAEQGALPVTIEHNYGSTTIDTTPSRIATLGPGDSDILLKLGIVPTTMAPFYDPTNRSVTTPWNSDLLEGANPTVLTNATSDLAGEVTKVLASNPQLIVAVNNAVTRPVYDNLAKVAGTIVREKQYDDWQVPWQAATTEVGKAVGKPAETARIVAETEKRFTDAKAANPQIVGRTSAVVIGSEAGGVYIYGPGDGRGQMLTNLGMEFPASLQSAITDGFYGSISDENLTLLNGLDKLVVVDYAGATDKLKANPAFAALDIVKRGDVVYVDQGLGSAMSVPTVLTIPYVLDRLVPQLAR